MRLDRLAPMLLLVVLLFGSGLAATRPAAAQAEPEVAAEPAPDDAFRGLQESFARLHRSLANGGGATEADRPGIEAFLVKVEAYRAAHPEHAGATAMAMEIHRWLGDDERANELFARLIELRPDDPALLIAFLEGVERREGKESEATLIAYRDAFARFPDDPTLRRAWAEQLRLHMRYDEVIALLLIDSDEIDPAVDPKSAFLLADCLYAMHRFEEANEIVQSIPEDFSTPGDVDLFRLKQDLQQRRPAFESYIEAWSAEQARRQDEATADDLPRVEILTSKGRIVVELFENEAPNSVANFIELAESGFYNQTTFHRYRPDYLIEGGDPNTKPDAEGTPGVGGPGYTIPDEHTADGHRLHFNDSIAMRSGAPNSAGSRFYFTHRPTDRLNDRQTVFGRVVDGREVVRALRKDDQIVTVIVLRKRDHAYDVEKIEESTPAG